MEDFTTAISIAKGCKDYSGGYHNADELEIFHHGIQTVVHALIGASKDPDCLQVKMLIAKSKDHVKA